MIRQDSPDRADAFGLKLWDRIDSLSEYPLRGHVLEEPGCEGRRDVSALGYRVIDRVDDSFVREIAIVHGSQLVQPQWLKQDDTA